MQVTRLSAASPSRGKAIPRRIASCLVLVLVMPASGCSDMQNNQKTVFGALGGGAVGSVACLLAHGSALACAAAGIGGAVIGGAIGHTFDERDRERRDAAVRQALYDQSLWHAVPGPMASSGTGIGIAAGTGTDGQQPVPARSTATIRHKPRHTTMAPPAVAWQNPDTDNSGAIVPLRTFVSPATGQDCKIYREDYLKEGKEFSETMQACPKADGSGFDIKPLS